MSEQTVKKYSLDASAILQISNMYPADRFPDLFEKVWEKIERAAKEGRVIVIDKVYNELARKDDFAHKWLLARKKDIIYVCGHDVIIKASEVIRDFSKLVDPDNEHDQADPYIVAHAALYGYVVVTAETKMPIPLAPGRRKDKIPNVCDHYGVENLYPKIDGTRMVTDLFEVLGFEK
jgi:hypothetical protein